VVNEGVVLQSELDEQVTMITRRLEKQQTQLPPANVLRQQILERLVIQEVQLQRAERAGIKVPDEVLNESLKDVAARNNMTLDQLPRALEAQGINYAAYRDSIRKEMTIQMLRQRDVLARIIVTPREIDHYLEKQQESRENSEYNVSHILLSLPEAASPGQLEEVQQRATDIVQRAREGEDFAQLAVSYSNSQTALEGGQLGWRKSAQLPTFIAELVSGMQTGQVSDPVRTPSGFHIIRLNDQRGAEEQVMINQVHVRHILMRTNELQDDETVRQKLTKLRERILAGEDFAGLAATTSEDTTSAAEGGDLDWQGPKTFVPDFERVIDGLEENEISEPFKTQYGWHIAQLLGRRVHDNTDEVRRQHAFNTLRESKADEETELWLRRLRDEAFIEYKM
jgi:peptidyl-prolyl cis-trans isomerase SurA